jgi:hypothetical protein
MSRRCILWAVLFALSATPLVGQGVRDPNNARGYDPGKLYSFSDLDAVNTFNGNLMVRLPIGQTYHVGASLSYRLQLTYNSKVWDYEFIDYDDQTQTGSYHRLAVPERDSNAGLGWSLSLGRVLPSAQPTATTSGRPWTYLAPDGSHHIIGDNRTTYTTKTVVHTDDGTFLRITHTSTAHVIEFPDGQIHSFDVDGDLTEIRDRFKNWIRVGYTATADGAPVWTITDGRTDKVGDREIEIHHRTHTVEFANADVETARYVDKTAKRNNPNFLQRVSKVSLAAFPREGETAESARAHYTFVYEDTSIARGSCGATLLGLDTEVNVAFLQKVILPDGTDFDMSYNRSDARASCESGTVQALRLPTMGSIEWKHGVYHLPTPQCSVPLLTKETGRGPWSYEQVGVVERKFNPEPTAPSLVWTYKPELIPGAREAELKCGEHFQKDFPGPPREFRNTVTTPSGLIVRHYFSAFNAERRLPKPEELALLPHYGLPYITWESDDGFHLSSETFVGDSVVRRNYVLYEHEPERSQTAGSMHRPIGDRTVFVSDTSCGKTCHIQSLKSEYDGFGNYRKTVTSSNFGPTRTETVDYNLPSRVTPDTWILNLYTKRTATETSTDSVASSARVTSVCFDSHTGALLAQRTQKEVVASNTDVLVRYTYDVNGNPQYEDWYGGDDSPLTSTSQDLCAASNAGESEYRIERTFEAGMLKTAKYRNMAAFDADYTVDTNTGLARASRDSAGVESTFEYDRMSRLVRSYSQEGMETTYRYTNATTTEPASVLMQKGGDNGTGTKREILFDRLGRPYREGDLMPGTSTNWTYRYTRYNKAGHVETLTELGNLSEERLPKTTHTYDVFDRLETVKKPDGTVEKLLYVGQGVRMRKRISSVKLPTTGPTEVTVTETYDSFGRLVDVAEPAGSTSDSSAFGSTVTTTYSYDVGGKLRLVNMKGDGHGQIRIFDYDGRGFLRWEMQPETGIVTYSYDSRGNLKVKNFGEAASQYDLRYIYDDAGRLTDVLGRNPIYKPGSTAAAEMAFWRVVKKYDYATTEQTGLESSPVDWGKGKLRSATRFNYPPPPQHGVSSEIIKVVERYYYRHADGVRTDRATDIYTVSPTVGDERLRQTVWISESRDSYGQVIATNYPMSVGAGAPRSSRIEYQWQRGRLTAVTGPGGVSPYVRSITYHLNGMRDTIVHGNGMEDKQFVDPSGMPRPARLHTGPYVTICLAPQIIEQPEGKKLGALDTGADLSVQASGTGTLTYQWHDAVTGAALPGQTNRTFRAPRQAAQYYVVVTNECNFIRSAVAYVVLDACPVPEVWANREITKTGMVTLRAGADGVGQFTYEWYRVSDGAFIQGGPEIYVTASLGLSAVEVRVTSTCDQKRATARIEAEPQLKILNGLRASVSADRKSIVVEWPAASGVQSYQLLRRGAGGAVVTRLVTGTKFIDTEVIPSAAYVYSLSGTVISNADVATTLPFTAATRGDVITTAYFNEILEAVNAIRAIGNWPRLTWQTIMPPSVPVPVAGETLYSFYFSALRPRMDESLQALGATVTPYTDPDPRTVQILALHMTELQSRAQ